jgi:hypothetical protein
MGADWWTSTMMVTAGVVIAWMPGTRRYAMAVLMPDEIRPPTVKQLGDPRKDATWTLLPPAPGVCQQCARDHEPGMPHDAQSLYYQYHFHAEHDRWPTWADALAHCTPEVREEWTRALRNHGVTHLDDIPYVDGRPPDAEPA